MVVTIISGGSTRRDQTFIILPCLDIIVLKAFKRLRCAVLSWLELSRSVMTVWLW